MQKLPPSIAVGFSYSPAPSPEFKGFLDGDLLLIVLVVFALALLALSATPLGLPGLMPPVFIETSAAVPPPPSASLYASSNLLINSYT